MAKDNIGKKARAGVLWSTLFQGVQYVLRFANSIILARLLFPEDFGLMGLAMIVLQFARRLTSFGFTMVLVQRKEVQEEHYDTVFWVNLLLIGTASLGIVLFAENIAAFLENLALTNILYAIAVIFLIEALSSVHRSILKRKLQYKELGIVKAVSSFVLVVGSAVFAFLGFGVWALIFGNFFGAFAKFLVSFIFTRWWPGFRFRMWALKDSLDFGIWVYVAGYVIYAINNVDFFVIGKFLSAAQLGYYERAFNLMSMPRKRLVDHVNSVMFSAYSRIQDDDERLVRALQRVIATLAVIIYPFVVWLFFVSPSFIRVVYGPKWIPTIAPLQIMCITGLIESFTLMFQPVLTAKGWIGNHTRREVVYLVILSAMVVAGLQFGIVGVAWGVTAAAFFRLALMLNLAIRCLPFTIKDFIKAQRSAVVYSGIQIGVLLVFQWTSQAFLNEVGVVHLIGVTALSFFSFLGSHFVFRFKDVEEPVQDIIKDLRKFAVKLPILGKIVRKANVSKD
ncbi:MAG: lipopolysaccharide biosynthesis protein [Calditrichia bacterium]